MSKRLPFFVTIALFTLISIVNYSCNPRDRIETNEGFHRKPVPLGELKDAQIWFTHYYSSIKPNKEFLRTRIV